MSTLVATALALALVLVTPTARAEGFSVVGGSGEVAVQVETTDDVVTLTSRASGSVIRTTTSQAQSPFRLALEPGEYDWSLTRGPVDWEFGAGTIEVTPAPAPVNEWCTDEPITSSAAGVRLGTMGICADANGRAVVTSTYAAGVESPKVTLSFTDVSDGIPIVRFADTTRSPAVLGWTGLEIGTRSIGIVHTATVAGVQHASAVDRLVVVPFKDVPRSRSFFGDILWMSDSGVAKGYPDRTFRPDLSVRRDAMAAFLYRYAHRGGATPTFVPPTRSPFSDLATTDPFYREITWLAAQGITTGYTDGTYRPEGSVNRDSMAAFLYRYAGSPAFSPPRRSPFTDVATTGPFYREITWLAGQEITTGYADGTFRPRLAVSRGAMSAFLHRANGRGI